MRTPYLIAAGLIGWWLLTRPTGSGGPAALPAANPYKADGVQTQKGAGSAPAVGTILEVSGSKYRVAGAPTAAGLVPVTAVAAPGAVAAAVLRWYDPRTGAVSTAML